jgi:hypothetical protein
MDWKRLVQFALLGSGDFGTIYHSVGSLLTVGFVSGPAYVHCSRYKGIGNTNVQLHGPFCSGLIDG